MAVAAGQGEFVDIGEASGGPGSARVVGFAVSGVLVAVGVCAASIGGEQGQALVAGGGAATAEQSQVDLLVAQGQEPVVAAGHGQRLGHGYADPAVGLAAAGERG
ncbi:hypothetical protein [Dietzia kunjamensis]|uniref:hypothetical protein n=1 Tax=Dietzia kunjamensis TaxID=322509 RepID=UPI0039BD019A